MGALLHDIGKLVLGFFFGDHFAKLLDQAKKNGSSFRKAESVLAETINHEYLGALLVLNAGGGPNLVKSVATHHCPENPPCPLVCLVHLADNLCKDLGLGFQPEDRGIYHQDLFKAMQMQPADIDGLKEKIGPL